MKNKILNTHTIHKKKKKNTIVPFIHNEKPKLLKKNSQNPLLFPFANNAKTFENY